MKLQRRSSDRHAYRFAILSLPLVLIAGLCAGPAAFAADESAPSASASAPQEPLSPPVGSTTGPLRAKKSSCIRNGGVYGFAALGNSRIHSGKVRVYAQRAKDPRGTFSRELKLQGNVWTNSAGGFLVVARCLPKTFLVKVSGGKVNGKRNHETVTSIGRSKERATILTPATSMAAQFMAKNHSNVTTALNRTTKYLRIVKLGNDAMDLGATTWSRNVGFAPNKFLKVAKKNGGVQSFAAKLAKRAVKSKAHRSFKPKSYTKPQRPGFPRISSTGTPRTRAKAVRSATRSSDTSDLMTAVAGEMVADATCAVVPPSPPSNLACADPTEAEFDEIENQLVAITDALAVLQEEVVAIQDTLNVMEAQLNDILSQLNVIEEQNNDSIQLNLQNEAESAQQDYQDAYSAAGIETVYQQVNEAYNDLVVLGSLTPQTTWTPVAPGSSNSAMCQTMYSQYNITTGAYAGQNPLSTCVDFLSQTQAFAGANPTYYSNLYKGLVGGNGLPQDDLVIWTYQLMLTYGGNVPVPTSTLQSIQTQAGQLGQLMDLGFTLAAAGQEFTYGATTGQNTTCPNLTTSGTFPGTTTLNVSSACETMQSGLFAASVQNNQALQISLPPTGTVSDPRTNYVWWSYPADLTASTTNSGGFPFWPGAPAGTYTTASGNPLKLYNYTVAANPSCCETGWLYPTVYAESPPPLLAASPAYSFGLSTQAQSMSLLSNLLLTEPSSIAATLVSSGFNGIGENQYGMEWTNLGMDPSFISVDTTLEWQSQTNMASTTAACTGYPPYLTGTFMCQSEGYYDYVYATYVPYTGTQALTAMAASMQWNLEQSMLPTSSSLTQCPAIGSVNGNLVSMCEENTFGLFVDTAAATSGTNVLPPFWAPSMLVGVPSSGVPAIPVPAPTPVSATS